MTPRIGCYLQASQIKDIKDTVVEGPIYSTETEIGGDWKFDEDEASKFANGLIGKPVRYCTRADDFLVDGVAKEHGCDVTGDIASIIGHVSSVHAKDSNGKKIWYAKATIKPGVDVSKLPSGWSIFGRNGEQDEDGYLYDVDPESLSFTSRPVYDAARPLVIAASKAGEISNLNINTQNNNQSGEVIMADGTNSTVSSTAAPVQTSTTTNPVMNTTNTPTTWTFTSLPNTQSMQTEPAMTKEDVDKIIESKKAEIETKAIERVRADLKKESLVNDLIEKLTKTGVLTDNDKAAKVEELQKLDVGGLEVMKSTIDTISSKVVKHETPLSDKKLPPQENSQKRQLKDGEKATCKLLGLTEEQWLKYNP